MNRRVFLTAVLVAPLVKPVSTCFSPQRLSPYTWSLYKVRIIMRDLGEGPAIPDYIVVPADLEAEARAIVSGKTVYDYDSGTYKE